uniref:Uncharacterized protein n=1 Tax=Rhizophora mucronata TaxID=61149 RepID=A0A2P2QAV0_RHIMU
MSTAANFVVLCIVVQVYGI